MKKIFILSAICLYSTFSFAQDAHTHPHVTPVSNPNAVETLSMKEAEYDFGKIPQGKPVTHIFEVTNTGKTPFKLDNVQAGCGCTTPEWEKDKEIAPGATAKITVGFNAAAEGAFNKPVTITYNGNQVKQFTIKGEVWKTPAESAPASAAAEIKN